MSPQMILLFVVIPCIHSFTFNVTSPTFHSIWAIGSHILIEWSLESVKLPYKDVFVTIDLCKSSIDGVNFYMTAGSALPNDGRFLWDTPLDILTSTDGFRLLVRNSDRQSTDIAGWSPAFFFQDLSSPSDTAITITSPTQGDVIYPGDVQVISWERSGSVVPDFVYGITVELRDAATRETLLTLAQNLTASNFHWSVPSNLLTASSPSTSFSGFLYMWGYDRQRNGLVKGNGGGFIVDYADTVPLTVRIVAPNAKTQLYLGASTTLVLLLSTLDNINIISSRNVVISISLYDDDNNKLLDIFEHFNIGAHEWVAGSRVLDWKIPDSINQTEGPSNPRSKLQHRRVFFSYSAQYLGKDVRKSFSIAGRSELFSLLATGYIPPAPSPGNIIKPFSALSFLAHFFVFFAICYANTIPQFH